MRKSNPNKNIIIILIVAIIVVTTISITAASRARDSKTNIVQSAVNDTISVVDKVITAPGRWLTGGVQSIANLLNTYEENQKLKNEVDQYDEVKQQTKNQAQEIERLKDELELNQTLTSYQKVTANVITRSPDTWQDMLIVDKGSSDGVEGNMAVMSKKGLIGRVMEVNAHSSKIQLLTSDNKSSNHFPVKISSAKGDSFGVLNKYDVKAQQLIASEITGEQDIKAGDVVQTSGLGGNSPADLAIGTVIKVKPDSYGLNREVYIKPYAQMYDISVVTIIQRMAGAAE
ncbi:rod shape-determining protein MreC [Enterococcus dongliensis]|uniref:Cell shape-determining protein MreC n=1 Tax=Enterococcus dongliensis TaxID=2559925 RepID=A0AAP5NKH9_9ENTE|nr:rod shape-determining protein MreC [Enterococcus dongliensis]MDT2596460.1 rod shape-determining protein MreC [Enterococcus dongliensis]MDT2604082.1 rod shape-determining protein MreC [Enterococcus dongliensis]MDT2634502.1 rod shape-determining protein MreC [Enterococcus dongliensis]MDT2636452.1 rod shape-determining protein MreC [Enterococcus dongliensis]MDT2640525.1 rod shape-determining protein MreC [Enterococcus dongliensis]